MGHVFAYFYYMPHPFKKLCRRLEISLGCCSGYCKERHYGRFLLRIGGVILGPALFVAILIDLVNDSFYDEHS